VVDDMAVAVEHSAAVLRPGLRQRRARPKTDAPVRNPRRLRPIRSPQPTVSS
jgi:hypothetical protein